MSGPESKFNSQHQVYMISPKFDTMQVSPMQRDDDDTDTPPSGLSDWLGFVGLIIVPAILWWGFLCISADEWNTVLLLRMIITWIHTAFFFFLSFIVFFVMSAFGLAIAPKFNVSPVVTASDLRRQVATSSDVAFARVVALGQIVVVFLLLHSVGVATMMSKDANFLDVVLDPYHIKGV